MVGPAQVSRAACAIEDYCEESPLAVLEPFPFLLIRAVATAVSLGLLEQFSEYLL